MVAKQPAGQKHQSETALQPAQMPLIDQLLSETTDRIDRVSRDYCTAMAAAAGHMRESALQAMFLRNMRKLLDDNMMALFMELMNTELGFLTDRPNRKITDKNDPRGREYSAKDVRECLIQAIRHGFFPTNNEFNIIGGRFYGAKNGYKRKLEEVPGITDIHIAPGTTHRMNGQCLVRVALSWKIDGVRNKLVGADGKPGRVFQVKMDSYSSDDQLVGKAERKAYKAAYERVTGSVCTEQDAEVGEVIVQEVVKEKPGNQADGELATPAQLRQLQALTQKLALEEDEWKSLVEQFGADGGDPELLTPAKAEQLILHLEDRGSEERKAIQTEAG